VLLPRTAPARRLQHARCREPAVLCRASRILLQQLFPRKLRSLPKVLPIEPQQIERVEQKTVLAASCELDLQFGKVGTAFVDDYDLAVDDGLVWKVEGTGNDGEALNPIGPLRVNALRMSPSIWNWTR
jgi:hypothetical protein